jgi:hypothetical protein
VQIQRLQLRQLELLPLKRERQPKHKPNFPKVVAIPNIDLVVIFLFMGGSLVCENVSLEGKAQL